MKNKQLLRKKFLKLRKKKYYEIPDNKLSLLIEYIKKRIKKKKLSIIALYYPSNFEFNISKVKFFGENRVFAWHKKAGFIRID